MSVKRRGADVKKDLEMIVKLITDNAERVRISAFNTVKGQMARRIWNNGGATDGRIGNYKPSTKKRRNEAGRRIDTVDLEMTGTLRRSFVVGVGDERRTQLGMADQLEPKISVKDGRISVTGTSNWSTIENAIQQEKNFNKEIFAPSKDELERGEKTVIKELNLIVQKALRQS